MDELQRKALLEKLQVQRQAFATALPQKINKIELGWSLLSRNLLSKGDWQEYALRNLHRMAHSLAGSGGTFGLPLVGDAARELEIVLLSLVKSKKKATPEQSKEIQKFLDNLRQVTDTSLGKITASQDPVKESFTAKPSTPKPSIPESSIPEPSIPEPSKSDLTIPKKVVEKEIFLVEDDKELTQTLAYHIQYFGYSVKVFPTLAQFKTALQQSEPAVIVMDIELPDGDGAQTLLEIQKNRTEKIPTIFLTEHTDLVTQLKAVEAGGSAFCTKPVDLSGLIDILDTITAIQDPEPFRVIIIDDSRSLAGFFSVVLQNAGMETCIVTEPLKALEPLHSFQPDLILLDLYMPQCSGLSLAGAIRQQESFVSIPIVFLSGETDVSKQLSAMSIGGDEFLTKPIKPDHLVQAVDSRIKRYRKLRALMIRDSLTGLLNHTNTKEQLDTEIGRAKRNKTHASFAMVDIDKFKNVNDTYGHPTGDRVIKSLSRLLKQRLRKSDIVGRYGGEEFAVILPDTDSDTAKKVLDELRKDYEKIIHQSEDKTFKSSFSCGIATFPDYEDGSSLNNAADRALYVAKKSGRNRVEIALPEEDEES